MLKGFWKLSWLETKIFMREPMGVIGSLIFPLIIFMILGRSISSSEEAGVTAEAPFNVVIVAALILAVSAVISLVAIISIYREGGILKRLRATPLSPLTILGSHVAVKLVFTVASLGLLALAGREWGTMDVNLLSFTAAFLLSTLSIVSVGFLIASLVPTARFAQPISATLLYPMVAISGVFFPLERMSPGLRLLALNLPTTHSVELMERAWAGSGWGWRSPMALVAIFAVCMLLSARFFRWE
jgi:ABC-2 type transport system permease protein